MLPAGSAQDSSAMWTAIGGVYDALFRKAVARQSNTSNPETGWSVLELAVSGP
jgi:hypothetical protein